MRVYPWICNCIVERERGREISTLACMGLYKENEEEVRREEGAEQIEKGRFLFFRVGERSGFWYWQW